MSQVTSHKSQVPADEPLVRVQGVSKKFCLSLKKSLLYGLQDIGNELLGRRHGGNGTLRPKEFWAVQGVDFELRRGECLGLIGRNGAGKTTLLKMLNGLIKPDEGRIEMRGRVGALIALGAGFNPILTGRENIYVNASVLGLSKKETDAKLEEIIDFAEIGDFMDTPVQNYSSGMAVRLGFAVASSLEPDVLLADEILAVGDAGFRAKCYRRFSALLDKGVSVIFVSHDIATIQVVCNKCLWLRDGQMADCGEVTPVTSAYSIWMDQKAVASRDAGPGEDKKTCMAGAKILDVHAVDPEGNRTEQVETGQELRLRFSYDVSGDVHGLNIGLSLRTKDDALYSAYATHRDGVAVAPAKGVNHIDLVFPDLCLGAGEYWISASLTDEKNIGCYDWNWNAHRIQIQCRRPMLGRLSMPHRWEKK